MMMIKRRAFLNMAAIAPVALASACTTATTGEDGETVTTRRRPLGRMPFGPEPTFPPFEEMYASKTDDGFELPAIPYTKIDERYLRQVVKDTTREKAGSIVVDTSNHYLYLVLGNGNAVRYGVGLGRAGFEWSGEGEVKRKASWPRWHPPEEMIDREPQLEKYRTTYDRENNKWLGGMDGGLQNPLGARALYIYQGNVDTLYRLHGSPQWSSIGKSVSSGCVRLINQDVIDLHSRVPAGTPIIVK